MLATTAGLPPPCRRRRQPSTHGLVECRQQLRQTVVRQGCCRPLHNNSCGKGTTIAPSSHVHGIEVQSRCWLTDTEHAMHQLLLCSSCAHSARKKPALVQAYNAVQMVCSPRHNSRQEKRSDTLKPYNPVKAPQLHHNNLVCGHDTTALLELGARKL